MLIAAKIGSALLLIYMFKKVFDLAAALGGGLNMGNNMVEGVRNMVQDVARSAAAGSKGTAGKRGSGGNNQISQGNSRQGGQKSSQSGGRNRGSAMQQIARNRTLTVWQSRPVRWVLLRLRGQLGVVLLGLGVV